MFTGFPEATIQFFLSLRFNNHVTFFEEHKEEYLKNVQAPFYAFIDEMAPHMREIDSGMEVRPAKCLARIRRDVRFTRDKSPFRDHLWLLFRKAAEPREGSLMFWFEVSPESTGWGMGFWGENRPVFDLMRRRMAANPKAFSDILESCRLAEHTLQMGGESFKRMAVPEQIPTGLQPWYTAKELYIHQSEAQLNWIYSPGIIDRVARDFKALAPMYKALRGLMEEISNTPGQM
jgi:uncharacterized protein (TIGR02453 family)